MVRPVFNAELGKFFRMLRESRKSGGRTLGLRQAVQLAERKGLTALTKSALHSLETGKTKNVDEDVLGALAVLYAIKYETLVVSYMQIRYGVALTDSATPAELLPTTPALDGPNGSEFTELWNRLGEFRDGEHWRELLLGNARGYLALPRRAGAARGRRKDRPSPQQSR